MIKEIVCVGCPNSCDMTVVLENDEILSVSGALCDKGAEFAASEIFDPRRTFSTLVKVVGGHLPLVSVRVSDQVPLDKMFDIVGLLKGLTLTAPVSVNQVITRDVLGLGVDVIATKNIAAASGPSA